MYHPILFLETHIQHTKIEAFNSLELIARQAVEGFITGLHKSPFHGFSVEFAEHRQYNAGESTRFVDWKLYGKTDKLYTKRFEEETNLRCQLVIDRSSSMYFPVLNSPTPEHPNKILFSVYAAAALATLMKKQRDAFGLTCFSDHMDTHTQVRSSMVHYQYLLTELEKLLRFDQPEKGVATDIAGSLHHLAEMIHQRSLVIIFSDMMDQTENQDMNFSALQHLKHAKHEVILFHVKDKNLEENLNFDNRPYRFVDMETEEVIKLNPMEIKENYQKMARNSRIELEQRCGRYGIDYVEADVNQGFEGILLPYFFKRQKLY